MADALSFGWITQPAFFDTPAGVDPRDPSLARALIEANERAVGQARDAGFDTIWVEDHMGWGDKAHLECFSNLCWLAGRNPGLRYGTLVCGQAFRNPAYLAKMAVNVQLLTDGRFILGLGAGNNGAEHEAFGYRFPAAGERIAQLDEAARIVRAVWAESPASFRGQHYRVEGAFSSPLPDVPIPLMIGGGGERRTLRVVAELGDWWCADVWPVDVFRHKLGVLDRHCEAAGRDPATITRVQIVWVSVTDRSEDAVRWPDLHIVAGDADEVTRELEAFRDAGVDHLAIRFMDHPEPAGFARFVEHVLPRLS
ncbi:MAG: LLM class flavin-dependent oxidoreductase [Chloroflexi bacterium]|nr:LLM class flavin-dependent oxidoreductase [Chloroflexota bacterium]